MCSVSGVLIFDPEKSKEVERKLVDLLKRAEDRGRDSYGVIVIDKTGGIKSIKSSGKPSDSEEKLNGIINEDSRVVIANNRAEPTTEYVKAKTQEDIQPFVGKRYVVTHNGIISNDIELERRYNLQRKTRIDSAILPPLLDSRWDGTLEGLRKVLSDIKGSFALIIADKSRPDRIFLAQNFKPLYMAYDFSLKAVFFSSLDEYFDVKPFDQVNVRKLEPYSVAEVTSAMNFNQLPLLEEKKRKKVLVIASGGLDSTVAATKLLREGYEVTLLHFNYHHKAEERERDAIRKIADYLNLGLMEIDTDLFKLVGNATLIKGGGEIVKDREGQEGAEFAHEWVPARNTVFISVALAIAESKGYDAIASGI
ncbi:7-cyano-7-deazaguanine synthase, partial [Acidianus sp. RZ1]